MHSSVGSRDIAAGFFILLLVVAGTIVEAHTALNHDVAWVLYSAGRLLAGGTFGIDIVAANPPLIWWVSAIPNAIATITALPLTVAFQSFIAIVALCSLATTRLAFGLAGSLSYRTAVLGLLAVTYTLLAGRDFGQREHLSLMLIVPYLIIAARRLQSVATNRSLALVTGLAAGVAVSFKPHFIIVPVLIEGCLLISKRSPRSLLRAETLAIAAVISVYGAAIVLFAKPYLTDVIPDVSKVYWGFELPFVDVLRANMIYFIMAGAGAVAVWRAGWPPEATMTSIAAAGFLLAACAQSKGYSYHFYPVVGLSLLSFALVAVRPSRAQLLAIVAGGTSFLLVGGNAAAVIRDRSAEGGYGKSIQEMSAFVIKHTPAGGSFLALSTHPYPGFPTTVYTDAEWASRSNSRIFLPAIVHLRAGGTLSQPELLKFAERKERASILDDLARKPALVIVDTRPHRHAIEDYRFDFINFYTEDQAFRLAWAAYRPIAGAPAGYAAFVRSPEADQ